MLDPNRYVIFKLKYVYNEPGESLITTNTNIEEIKPALESWFESFIPEPSEVIEKSVYEIVILYLPNRKKYFTHSNTEDRLTHGIIKYMADNINKISIKKLTPKDLENLPKISLKKYKQSPIVRAANKEESRKGGHTKHSKEFTDEDRRIFKAMKIRIKLD